MPSQDSLPLAETLQIKPTVMCPVMTRQPLHPKIVTCPEDAGRIPNQVGDAVQGVHVDFQRA